MSDNYKPIMRFAVVSDIHIKDHDSVERERLANAIKYAYEFAENSEYKNLDAFVIDGDFADNGSEIQMNANKEILDKNLKDGTQLIMTLASHEFSEKNGGRDGAIERFKRIFSLTEDTHAVINGFHFVAVTCNRGAQVNSDEKLEWLQTELQKAADDDGKKPIFVFQHPHVQSTVSGGVLWGEDAVIPVYMNFPQIINFSGHSHAPINDPRSIHQEHFTSLGCGTLSYFENDEFDKICGTFPPKNKDQAAQMLIVEADAENHVRIYPYDVLTHQQFPLVWDIEKPWDTSSFKYTNAYRMAHAVNPYFEENSKFEISEITDNSCVITFEQAKISKEYVNDYYITVTYKSTGLTAKKFSIWSDYYFSDMPKELTWKIEKLKPDTEYDIEIKAGSFWKTYSEPIKKSFKTK